MKKILPILVVSFFFTSFISPKINPIRWNFRKFKELTYTYEQIMRMETPPSFKDNKSVFNKSEGQLKIKVKDNEFADIIFTDVKMKLFSIDSLGDTSILANSVEAENLIDVIREDGTIKGESTEQNRTLVRVLFPVTNKRMDIGDSADIPFDVSFNLYQTKILAKGYNRVKVKALETNIVQLETLMNASDYSTSQRDTTKYLCYAGGISKYGFDLEKGYFTSGEVMLNMTLDAEKPFPVKEVKSIMKMTSTIKLRLVHVE